MRAKERRASTYERESGIGLPHSKTLARRVVLFPFRKVSECGSPMPLLLPFVVSQNPFRTRTSPLVTSAATERGLAAQRLYFVKSAHKHGQEQRKQNGD